MSVTLTQYHSMLNTLISTGPNLADRLLVLPANEMISNIDFRITQEGKDSFENQIGQYSKKPSLATKSSFTNKARFKPDMVTSTQTKFDKKSSEYKSAIRQLAGGDNFSLNKLRKESATSKTHMRFIKFKNAKKAVPVQTLEEGYFELRALDGYSNDKVVLEKTGSGIKNIKVGNETDKSVAIGFTDLNQSVKFRGYEKRKDVSVLAPTQNEIAELAKAQAREMSLFIKETFGKTGS